MTGFSFGPAFALLATAIASASWSALVSKEVQDPYLVSIIQRRLKLSKSDIAIG
jgi:hypothetical protein